MLLFKLNEAKESGEITEQQFETFVTKTTSGEAAPTSRQDGTGDRRRTKQPVKKTKKKVSSVFRERLARDPDSAIKDQILNELVASQPGQRIITETGETIGQKSTFPDWVPSHLRSTKLFEQVIDDVEADRAPKSGTKRFELYSIVQNRINQQLELPEIKEFPGQDFKTRGLASSVESRAIASKLTKKFKDLPDFPTVNLAEQAQEASQLLASNPDQAMRIAMGVEQPPQGLIQEMVFIAVENKAVIDKDVETLHRLATSSELVTEATVMGQRIRALGESDIASPVAAVRKVVRAREKSAKGKTKKAETKIIKKNIKAPGLSKLQEFINALEC